MYKNFCIISNWHNFRPVIAIIDVEIEKVSPGKLGTIHQEVMTSYGPADPTIIVSIASDENDVEVDMEELMEELDNYGNVVLVRWDNKSFTSDDR